MKYLKKYESASRFFSSMSELQYYASVSNPETLGESNMMGDDYNFICNNWEDFTEEEIEIIKSYFTQYTALIGYNAAAVYGKYDSIHPKDHDFPNGIISFFTQRGPLKIHKITWGTPGFHGHMIHGNSHKLICSVIKMKDEWYYVKTDIFPEKVGGLPNFKYYACDQWTGLIELLSTLKSI